MRLSFCLLTPLILPVQFYHSLCVEISIQYFHYYCFVNIVVYYYISVQFSCSVVSDFTTPCTVACQASLLITNFWSLLKLMSIESLMPSNHLILCRPLLPLPSIFPYIRVFPNELALHISGQSIGASASASVLPMNIQD